MNNPEQPENVLNNSAFEIVCQAHVQDMGWLDEVKDGAMSGNTGEKKSVETPRIRLEGQMEERHIYYHMYSREYVGLGWAKNGDRQKLYYVDRRMI